MSLGALYAATEEYEFVPNTDRWVSLHYGQTFSIGKLDAKGNFLPDANWVNLRGTLTSAPGFVALNVNKGPAYEFRSSRLILGELDKEGNFIPKLDSKVIEFKDYRFSKTGTRIYNLPGKFVKKKDKDAKK